MRKRRNCQMMVWWRIYRPSKCHMCGKDATIYLRAGTFFCVYGMYLCDECAIAFAKGELYID